MLAFYKPNKKCILATDAYSESTGGILLELNKTKKNLWHILDDPLQKMKRNMVQPNLKC